MELSQRIFLIFCKLSKVLAQWNKAVNLKMSLIYVVLKISLQRNSMLAVIFVFQLLA